MFRNSPVGIPYFPGLADKEDAGILLRLKFLKIEQSYSGVHSGMSQISLR